MLAAQMRGSRFGLLGAGRQALETIEYCHEYGMDCAFLVEESPPPYERSNGDFPGHIFTFDELPRPMTELPVLVAVGAPETKRRLVERWPSELFFSVISQHAWCASNVRVGAGSTIAPFASLNTLVEVGSHALVNVGAILSHDVIVGDYATIGPNCAVGGRAVIGTDVFLGIGSTVIDGIAIGAGSFVAAGSVVVSNVPDNSRIAGVPARPMAPK